MSIPIEIITDEILAEKSFFWRETDDGVKVLISSALENAGFTNGFSTRLGGVSPFPANDLNLAGYDEDSGANIAENRRRFLRAFAGEWQIASCWQIHGDEIRFVERLKDAADKNDKKDALIANVENVLLGVKTADCVPILLGDTKTGAFAAIHAGWRGTVNSIAVKTIAQMREKFGTNPADLIAAIGAAASCRNYEIGADVIELFRRNFPASYEKYFQTTRENHALVDLQQAVFDQLTGANINPENIYTAPFCTMERTDLFFSYRAEKKLYGKTGRLLSVIGRRRSK